MTMYKVAVSSIVFFKYSSKIYATDVKILDGQVVFFTDKKTYKFLISKDENIVLLKDKFKENKKRLSDNKGLILGVIFFCFCIFLNKYRVSNIVYNNEYIINQDITYKINSESKTFLFWEFYTKDLNELSEELRSQYINYQWIKVSKIGSVISVYISDFDSSQEDYEDGINGDIVATKSGIISSYIVYNGMSVVECNDYVEKGDLLISGDRLFDSDESDYTYARGEVLAYTYETVNYTVLKEETTLVNSGNTSNYKSIDFFSFTFNLFKQTNYKDYDISSEVVFDFFGLIKVKKVVEYEKYDIINTYDKTKALDYVENVITENFSNSKTSLEESIVKMEVLKTLEDNESFHITMLVKKQESIGKFVAIN